MGGMCLGMSGVRVQPCAVALPAGELLAQLGGCKAQLRTLCYGKYMNHGENSEAHL